ncbi:MAG: adenylyltransferase/cytidyltransferase family protein [Flavobacteriales bacterium]
MSRLAFLEAKVITVQQAAQLAEMHRLKNQKIVFTNGCFDLLHLGHITYLAKAASLGDKLFVAVNDDASVRALAKGENRPINPELARAMVLASLGMIDHVIIFSEDTPLNTILAIKPDLIVKGGDYDAAVSDPSDKRYIVGKKEAETWEGSVQTIPLVEGYSTTSLLAKR